MCFVQCFNGITITIINMGRKFSGVGGFPFNTKYPALRPTSIPSGILMHAAPAAVLQQFGHNRNGPKIGEGALPAFWVG